MSEKIWSDDAWEDYLYWQMQDKKTALSTTWKMDDSTSHTAEVTIKINNTQNLRLK